MSPPTPEAVFALLEGRPGAVWLDGGAESWSVIAWEPESVIVEGSDWPRAGRSLTRASGPGDGPPFRSGVIGYLSYGAGHQVAPVPREAQTPEPEIWLGRYSGALCYHGPTRRWVATGSAQRDLLEEAEALPSPPPAGPSTRRPSWSRQAFLEAVERIRDLLSEGDCYQVNLTRAEHVLTDDRPFDIYRRLRHSNASWGAFLRLADDMAVLCNSPEQFLIARGSEVCTDPIKGTRARAEDADADRAAHHSLLTSPKDLAELTMIVDLVRNDLGRVAAVGSVTAGPRRITGHANVWHSSQAVSATLASGRDVWDALAATFPPGSVTGAPKVRACQRIAELEPEPRGVYCGSIGYVSDCGESRWNVAIRTGVWQPGRMRYHVGGGIVIASDPASEWQETIDKARELERALGLRPSSEASL